MRRDWTPEDDASANDPGGVGGDFRSARLRATSPMTWSLPLFRLGGVSVRMHALFLLLAAVELLRSSVPGATRTLALPPTALVLGFLLVLSLLHEAARTVTARRAGGLLDEWLLWPLGGLVGVVPGESRRPVWAEMAGWAAVLTLAVANGVTLHGLTGRVLGVAIPSPWTLEEFRALSLQGNGTLVETLWLLQWASVLFLGLGLVPAAPLPAGRLLAAWMSRRMGWSAGVRRSARVGLVCAVLLLVAGLVWDAWTLTALALLAWVAVHETLTRVEEGDEMLDMASAPESAAAADDQAELDRILEKINRHGLASLSFLERRRLKAATRRRRQGDGGVR